MSPRKAPQCRTCGSPMAGHKRPRGKPVCPERGSTPVAPEPIPQRGATPRRHSHTPEADFQLPRNGHWRNPHWVSPVREREVERSMHSSWAPTEVDGDSSSSSDEGSQVGNEETVLYDLQDDDDVRSVAAASTTSSRSSASTSSVRSTLSQLVTRSVPMASVWSTPTRDIPAISHAATKAGVSFAVVPAPKERRERSVKPDGSSDHGDALERQNSWWLVMGRDVEAVTRMIANTGAAAQGQEGAEEDPCLSGLVGAYPIHHAYLRPTFLDILFAGAMGGLVVFCGLSML
ncbi:uncharacterized protein C8Q71DRAFT_41127 [Rhodofomes roseus]|uniref:Uncharacterized protein n=1 Tax=Rhodofomes roseus TaxID=34475 RepID=A0ABQ8KZC0_9APHY|nr:uncharacterized protein C8Q71DRAFT_41127 [Rhodofomes roseus]KAH9844348.1 hypothetical protein C8Q71DRAFT_41127 [Rhodofomes roseus]